jgi:hypothetical protein
MTKFIEWLEQSSTRTRKVLAVFTAIVWLICVIASYVLVKFQLDTIAILSLVTAQFATVIGFYMVSKADTD